MTIHKYRRPLRRGLILACLLFIGVLSILVGIKTYNRFRAGIIESHKAYITDLLNFTASNIDVEDLKECLASGVKSEKYEQLQVLLDNIKDTHNIFFIYVVIPLHAGEHDNVMNVIAGVSAQEKEEGIENVELGGLTGDSYPAKTAAKYYNAINKTGDIVFFEDDAEWGKFYTGVYPLLDSSGEFFAQLCVNITIPELNGQINEQVISILWLIAGVGVFFTCIFIVWSNRNITNPIKMLEKSVVGFASQSNNKRDVEGLIMADPDIHTGNEIEGLSKAILKMADDIVEYVRVLASTEHRAEELGELATKDSLTGVRNKTAYDRVVHDMEELKEKDYGVVMIDLNYLKRINDTQGHDSGDVAIMKLCWVICEVFAHSPVFRVGGDEFVVIVKGHDYEHITELEKEFYETLSERQSDENKVSAALGYALFEVGRDKCYHDVFKRADKAMYEAKVAMKAERR